MSNLNTNETTSNTNAEAAVKTATVNDISLPKGQHSTMFHLLNISILYRSKLLQMICSEQFIPTIMDHQSKLFLEQTFQQFHSISIM